MQFCFVRHGESASNESGVISGAAPGPDLTELGRKQAVELGLALTGLPIAAIYASPLSRARVTAELVGAEIGQAVECRSELMELGVGQLEGEPVETGFPLIDQAWHRWVVEGELDRPVAAGGESARDVLFRFDAFIDEVTNAHHEADTVLVVGHGGFLQLCLPIRCGNLPDDFGPTNWLRNCQQVAVSHLQGQLRCHSWAGAVVETLP